MSHTKDNRNAWRMVAEQNLEGDGRVLNGEVNEAQAATTVQMSTPSPHQLGARPMDAVLPATGSGQPRIIRNEIVFAIVSWDDGEYLGPMLSDHGEPVGMTETNDIIREGMTWWDCFRRMKPIGVANLDVPQQPDKSFGVFANGGMHIKWGAVTDAPAFTRFTVDYPNTAEKQQMFEESLSDADRTEYVGRGVLRVVPLTSDFSPLCGESGRQIRDALLPVEGSTSSPGSDALRMAPLGAHLSTVADSILANARVLVTGMLLGPQLLGGVANMGVLVANLMTANAAPANINQVLGMSLMDFFDPEMTGVQYLQKMRALDNSGADKSIVGRVAALLSVPEDATNQGEYVIPATATHDFKGLSSGGSPLFGGGFGDQNAAIRYALFTAGRDVKDAHFAAHQMVEDTVFATSQTSISPYNGGLFIRNL